MIYTNNVWFFASMLALVAGAILLLKIWGKLDYWEWYIYKTLRMSPRYRFLRGFFRPPFVKKERNPVSFDSEVPAVDDLIEKIWVELDAIDHLVPRSNQVWPTGAKYKSDDPTSTADHLTKIAGRMERIKERITIWKNNLPVEPPNRMQQQNPPVPQHGSPVIERWQNEQSTDQTFGGEKKENTSYLDPEYDSEKPPVFDQGFGARRDSTEYRAEIPSNDPLENLRRSYNEGVTDRFTARHSFFDKYPKIHRLGNRYAVEQSLGHSSNIEFGEAENGDLLAIKNTSDGTYMVVPQFDVTIKDTTMEEGGFGTIFEFDEYDPTSSFSGVKVVTPAIFEEKGGRWNLKAGGKGRLTV